MASVPSRSGLGHRGADACGRTFTPTRISLNCTWPPLSDIETILENMPGSAPSHAVAFQRIREHRKMRNLMAHFAVRRFPNEDAFVFVTKNAADFERVLGFKPAPGMMMTGVADVGQVREIVKMLDGVLTWLSRATRDVEDQMGGVVKR